MSSFYTLSDSVVSTITNLQKRLWELVNSSSSYSFVREPLPVFYLLLARYSNQDVRISADKVERYVTNMSFEYSTDRDNLLDNFPNSCEKVLFREKEIFERFFELITNGYYEGPKDECTGVITHGIYKYMHKELVEFFIQKYSELSHTECAQPEEILDMIFWECAPENEFDYNEVCPVYVPFSGLSSYFLHAEENCSFVNHCCNEEPNENLAFMAKVRLNAWGYPSRIVSHANPIITAEEDSLKKWEWARNWVMVSIPPFGLNVNQKDENGRNKEIDIAEFLINRYLEDENINSAYLVLPLSFCYSSTFEHLRKKIVGSKYLREVVEIPARSFKTTSIATVMISLNKWGSDTVDFGELNKKNDKGLLDKVEIDNSSVVQNNYLIVPSLYINEELNLKDGQVATSLSDIVDICEPIKSVTSEETFILEDTDFINSTDELFAERNLRTGLPLNNHKLYSGKCLVLKKRLNGVAICPVEGTFATDANSLVLNLKNGVTMSLNYLAHCVLESEQIKTASSYGAQLNKTIVQLMLNVKFPVFPTPNMQEALMVTLKDQYIQRKEREFRAEMERYGIRAASSDLNHLLGPTYSRIHSVLNKLGKDEKGQPLADAIRSNIAYMNRMIKHAGLDFSNYQPMPDTFDEIGVNNFFREYIEACRELSITSYQIEYETSIDDDTTICVNDDMFRYLLDTILDNVYRHGFEQKDAIGAMVRISTTPTLIDEKPYLLLTIANNGNPLADDFSMEKFIGRGECCGDTRHTGLGGYHIYHIIKNHDGYLNITASSAWPVIYEILIPIEDSFEDDTKLLNYENRANSI